MVRLPVSHLVVDVERFADDQHEPMATGEVAVVSEKPHALTTLRQGQNKGGARLTLRR